MKEMERMDAMSEPKKYRKKPVEIEAMQWDGTAEGATPIINWVLANDGNATFRCDSDEGCGGTAGTHYLVIRTLEGDMLANSRDYVIRGVQGEFYPCRADIFAATYDEVSDD
ncbi:hypothetical protein SEA_PARVUSTARDA_93 [Gordonia phage ParvusTarda]|uniref:Uncharacterized protein n=1 Tax=Gordonia phage ParvusTarda TaxID=2927261 RepID=A0A9E7QRN9_9CAUD|nr:hypothetical protein SEA_PARVUSTARDA_93 [Gordonia phage ParvusTarda]